MTASRLLLEKARAGFETLDVSEQYVTAALSWMEVWLTDSSYSEYVPQIHYLIESEQWNFLLDSFYQVIPFGTGGRRGLVGIGPNRINTWTIQSSAQGHSQYLMKKFGKTAQTKGVVFTYDVRQFTQEGIYNEDIPNPLKNLSCEQLAVAAAEVYAANGIKVYMFNEVRSTPELSFAIRHLGAISGVMISASHNLPTDNGKKVYDEFGGQLIPPDDQALVDEVTQNVKEIKTVDLHKAEKKGLVVHISDDVDKAFQAAICAKSLAQCRDLKILYSPLHGTGLTSVYPVLQTMDFDVVLDPGTSNLSGKFENVTFNIPNPEVVQSFDTCLQYADEIGADIIISSDPDADRIGVMVKHNNSWRFLSGNEIGIILTNYAISQYKTKGLLRADSVVIKTGVTTSLIETITRENSIQCIGNLLVGFKYIAHEMNNLQKQGLIDRFIVGLEESHGVVVGDYCRDKDAAGAALWMSELAAELKKDSRTLVDYLDEIYCRYGYCHNYLTEVRLLGAKGMEQILTIMDHLRKNTIETIGDFTVSSKIDRWEGDPQPHLSATDTSARNFLVFTLRALPDTQGITVTVRPSGTEPKVKMYFEIIGKPFDLKNIQAEKEKIIAIRENLEKVFMQYCYKIVDIDFPERGFLLFWQLPVIDKLKYFEVEDEIVALKQVADTATRRDKLFKLLEFLGANPVEKVDKAFKAKYESGILEYLNIGQQD